MRERLEQAALFCLFALGFLEPLGKSKRQLRAGIIETLGG